jgi:hypothetical protein
VIDENGLEIGNDGRFPNYWPREDHEGELVNDMTVANQPIMKWCILVDDHATRSDHEDTEWEVELDGQEEEDHDRVVGSNLAGTTEEHLAGAKKFCQELAKERAQLSAECTADEVEHKATWCQKAMSSVLNATAKKI